MRVQSALGIHAIRTTSPLDGDTLTLVPSPSVRVPVNTPLDLHVLGDVAAAPTPSDVRAWIADSTALTARDYTTRDSIPTSLTAAPLPGRLVHVQARAETLVVRTRPRLAGNIAIGTSAVDVVQLTLRHPGLPGTAAIRLDSLTLHARDAARQPLDPGLYVARLHALSGGVELGAAAPSTGAGDAVSIPLGGPMVTAGETLSVQIQMDIGTGAPAGTLEFLAVGNDLHTVDSNLGIPPDVVGESPADLPLLSGLASLVPPSRELRVGLESTMPAVLVSDGRPVVVARIRLANPAGGSASSVQIEGLRLLASERSGAHVNVGASWSRIQARVVGSLLGTSGALTSDSSSATIAFGAPLGVFAGAPVQLEVEVIPQSHPTSSSVRLGLDASGVGVIQPQSALLQVAVLPEAGGAFPLWTAAGGVGATDLAASFTNFPNPFAAGRDATTIGYYLESSARVTLRVLTITGEVVRTLVNGADQGAGMHQELRWDGRNGSGLSVRNGVYAIELEAAFDDGRRTRAIRKVGVVR